MEDVRINSDRLWASLMEMARIGGTPVTCPHERYHFLS